MVKKDNVILLLEPDDAVRAALVSLLRQHQWQAVPLENGGSLEGALSGQHPVALVSESSLPDRAATDVLDACKAAHVPVIFLGHEREIQGAVDLMRRGALDYLEKPFPQRRFIQALDDLRNEGGPGA